MTVTSINSCLESFTVFSWKIVRRCLTFDAMFVLLLYVQCQQLWSLRDGQFTWPHFFLGKLEQAVNQYFVHILSLVTDNNPSWIIQRKGGECHVYLITKETWHILYVNFLVVKEYDAHLSFHYVKLNNDRQRCTEISWKAELISDGSYQTSRNPKIIFCKNKEIT